MGRPAHYVLRSLNGLWAGRPIDNLGASGDHQRVPAYCGHFYAGCAFGRTGQGKGHGLLRSDSASAANCGSTRVDAGLDQRGVDSLARSSSFGFRAPQGRRPPEETSTGRGV